MPVTLLSADKARVEMLFNDVHTIEEAAAKYNLPASRFILGSHAPGMVVDASGAFHPPAEGQSDITPATIKVRQLIIGMHMAGKITAAEAEAWSEGNALPQTVLDAIDQLPVKRRLHARITARKMTDVERSDPMVERMATLDMADATPEQRAAAVDELFRQWSQI